MEVYYKDFISEETSLEKLVDDLARVVQGADELAQASGVHLPEEKRREITTRSPLLTLVIAVFFGMRFCACFAGVLTAA